MTNTPSRNVSGLPPRQGLPAALTRLQRRNRTPQEESTTGTPAVTAVPMRAEQADEPGASRPDRVTVYLPPALRARARTAYRATAHLEGDRTWSEFVERAILAEVHRRELEHNHGDPYEGYRERLAPGRPPA